MLIHVMKGLLNESVSIMGSYCFFSCLNTLSLFVWLQLRKLLSNLLCGSSSYWFSCISDDTGNRLRFQLELEFVQCLANPNYLNCEYLKINIRILRNEYSLMVFIITGDVKQGKRGLNKEKRMGLSQHKGSL